jgi:hypothetical protein
MNINLDTGVTDAFEYEHALLTGAQCDTLVERLFDLEAFWISRHPRLPFHTLGATNYYDITANPARPYARLARQYNPFLLEHFADLYATLFAALGEQLRQPVAFLADAALPGFHLFGAHSEFTAHAEHDVLHSDWFRRRDGTGFPGNPIHVDTAHLALGLVADAKSRRDCDTLDTLSFTLPLRVPDEGAGMKLWPFGLNALRHLDDEEQRKTLRACETRHVAYRPGTLFVHSGNHFHQACGFPVMPGQYRITLQGHGVWLDRVWRLFW